MLNNRYSQNEVTICIKGAFSRDSKQVFFLQNSVIFPVICIRSSFWFLFVKKNLEFCRFLRKKNANGKKWLKCTGSKQRPEKILYQKLYSNIQLKWIRCRIAQCLNGKQTNSTLWERKLEALTFQFSKIEKSILLQNS